MSVTNSSPLGKLGKVLIIVGIALCALLLLAILIFVLGWFIFFAIGEGRYFARYVVLDGYFPVVNLLFLIDYILMFAGSLGIPVLITGLICKAASKK